MWTSFIEQAERILGLTEKQAEKWEDEVYGKSYGVSESP